MLEHRDPMTSVVTRPDGYFHALTALSAAVPTWENGHPKGEMLVVLAGSLKVEEPVSERGLQYHVSSASFTVNAGNRERRLMLRHLEPESDFHLEVFFDRSLRGDAPQTHAYLIEVFAEGDPEAELYLGEDLSQLYGDYPDSAVDKLIAFADALNRVLLERLLEEILIRA